MPIYEYECNDCSEIFETLVPRPTDKSEPCPACGSENTRKLLSVTSGIIAQSASAPACPVSGMGCPGGMPGGRRPCAGLRGAFGGGSRRGGAGFPGAGMPGPM
ncbi:MAG: zinc ribbon domain-containing protein [Desulfovibrionaceae bacterium]|nr:zinc ribbon domain-containing protein [Desulfovibrionaceae bacterium]